MQNAKGERRMKRLWLALAVVLSLALLFPMSVFAASYPDVSLSGGYQAGHFDDIWDLNAGDITLSFTYNGNGMVDDFGGAAHAWAELGVRSASSGNVDFNPYWRYTSAPQTIDLIAGQNTDAGDVTVWGDGTNLYVKYEASDGWLLTETHLQVATSLVSIPQTKKGNPIPGQFTEGDSYSPPQPEDTFAFNLADNGWGVDTPFYIAAHAVVVKETSKGVQQETGWAAGTQFSGKNWATYFTYVPTKEAGSGVWLATDYDWSVNTFDPDVTPTLDLDDKLILQRKGGQGEGDYNLPSTPPAPGNNHRVWWDRDGVDPYQNPATANTGGIYQIVITLHATSATTGTAYMKIRGLNQGFEVDGNWNTIELTPAGMTFTGDMAHMQVFYGLYGYGATHTASFTGITVSQ